MIGLSVCNDVPSVAAPGSKGPVTGTNPIAYALPAERDPVFFDAAISTVAGGKVYAARALGQPIPDDWLIGSDGRPTTDASLYPTRCFPRAHVRPQGLRARAAVESLSAVGFPGPP